MFKSLQSTKSLKYITSTIILKIVMALTGLLLVGFLFAHAAGNLQYFLGPEAYNTYATFLQEGIGEILWIMRGVLLLCVVIHIISAIYLRIYNNAAKPQGYQIKNYVKTKLTARSMLWTGLLLASCLTFHLLHFTGGVVEGNGGHQYTELYPVGTFVMDASGSNHGQHSDITKVNEHSATEGETCAVCSFFQIDVKDHIVGICPETGKNLTSYESTKSGAVIRPRNDAYAMVTAEFSNPWVVLVYIIFVTMVGFHLNHAIESGFQTIGIQGPKFTPFIRIASVCLSVLLVLLMIILPLSVLVKSLFGSSLGGF